MVCQYHHRLFFITFIFLRHRIRQIFTLRVQHLPCHLANKPAFIIFHHWTFRPLVRTFLFIVVCSPATDMIGFMFDTHIHFFYTVVAKVAVVQVTLIAIINRPGWHLYLKCVIQQRHLDCVWVLLCPASLIYIYNHSVLVLASLY